MNVGTHDDLDVRRITEDDEEKGERRNVEPLLSRLHRFPCKPQHAKNDNEWHEWPDLTFLSGEIAVQHGWHELNDARIYYKEYGNPDHEQPDDVLLGVLVP